jgi:hypothetical protein
MAIICIIVIIAMAMISNPSWHGYITWMQDFAEREMAKEINGDSPLHLFTNGMSSDIISEYLHTSTEFSNYLVFSLYRTDFPNGYITALGLFGHFVYLIHSN